MENKVKKSLDQIIRGVVKAKSDSDYLDKDLLEYMNSWARLTFIINNNYKNRQTWALIREDAAASEEVTEAVSVGAIEVAEVVSEAVEAALVVDSSKDHPQLLLKSQPFNMQWREISSLWSMEIKCHFWLVKFTAPLSSLWARSTMYSVQCTRLAFVWNPMLMGAWRLRASRPVTR